MSQVEVSLKRLKQNNEDNALNLQDELYKREEDEKKFGIRSWLDKVTDAAMDTSDDVVSKVNPSLLQCESTESAVEVCRICHGADIEERFISPCKCKGSLAKVHRSCLERWLAEADLSSCELCGHTYLTRRLPKYSLISSIWRWLLSSDTRRERRDLFFDMVTCAAFTPVAIMGTYLTIIMTESLYLPPDIEYSANDPRQVPLRLSTDQSGNDWLFDYWDFGDQVMSNLPGRLATLSMVSLMTTLDLAYASWVLIRFQFHVSQWYSWYRRNSKVFLLSPPYNSPVTQLQTNNDNLQ